MYSSKEELIEMSEVSSTHRKNAPPKKPRRRNKIHSPPMVSPVHSTEKDVATMFSVKKAVRSPHLDEEYTETISEISDGEFPDENQKFEENIEKSSENISKSETLTISQSYRDKIRKRFNAVKEQASRQTKKRIDTKEFVKLTVERVRRETDEIDASVEMVRNRFHLGDVDFRKEEFLFFTQNEPAETQNADDTEGANHSSDLFQHQLPQNVTFNMQVSEKDLYFVPNKQPLNVQTKIEDEEPRYLEDEGFFVDSKPPVSRKNLNILEHRLLSVDDKKWFNCQGDLNLLSTTIANRCLRPSIITSIGDHVVYATPKLQQDIEEVVVIKENILELSISALKFTHHALFSVEHVLQEKLKQSFEKYTKSVENNTLQKLKNQLEAFKHAKKTKKGSNRENVTKEIKKVHEEIFNCGKLERENLKLCLDSWKALKKVRQDQNFSSTTVKLFIKKEKTDINMEKISHKKFFADILKDVLEEYRADFKKKLKEYHRKLQEKDEIASVRSDSDDTSEVIPEKPIYDVDEKSVEHDLRKRFAESFKPPGEPIITLALFEDNEITKTIENDLEIARRKSVESTKIFLRIFCNKIFVCKSNSVQLNDRFVMEFNEAFSIQLTDVPKNLNVEIVEQPKGLIKRKLCQLQIELPPQNVSFTPGKKLALNFEMDDMVRHNKHSGVGSGVKFDEVLQKNGLDIDNFMDLPEQLKTQGCISCSVCWQKPSSDPIHSRDGSIKSAELIDVGISDKYGAINLDNFVGWMDGKSIDPQDPMNSILYEYLDTTRPRDLSSRRDAEIKYFRLSPFSVELSFCDPVELTRNVRLQYLKLRDRHEIEFDGMTVPSRSKEIPLGPLRDYRKRKALEEFKEEQFDSENRENKRNAGRRFLKQVYTKIFQKCKRSDNNLDYDSVVDERLLNYFEQVIKTSLENLLNWFKWTPGVTLPLPKIYKPAKIERDPKSIDPPQTKIEIIILSAKNVPTRAERDKNRPRSRGKNRRRKVNIDGNKETDKNGKLNKGDEADKVKPFLEVTYEGFSAKTSVGSGSNPIWNEVVVLPLEYHQTDYLNPNSLSGSISIELFDLLKSNNESDEEHVHWLGEVKIPISALTIGHSVKGWFKLKLPHLLLNYDLHSDDENSKLPTSLQHNHAQNCYLELELGVCPNIPHLQPNMEDLPSNDLPYVRDHCMEWNRNFNDTFPNMKFSAFAIDTSGRTNCITRYLKPLEAPQLKEDEFDITAEQCARYVSLIPFTDSNSFYQNVWLTSEQLLTFMVGSTVDHAVTLTCFLLGLKLDAWLLLGFGLPHGSTAYVLVREYNRDAGTPKYYIYDVTYNEKWQLNDPHCPLQKVYCLVNSENVWGNTQKADNPGLLRFDLTRQSDWWPLFDTNVAAPLNFVNNKIFYIEISNTEDLERKIERKLKKKFAKLRPLNRTMWQHRLSDAFKNSLRQLENSLMYGKSNTEIIMEIRKVTNQYSVTGLTLNLPFIDVKAIIKEVKKLNVHLQPPEIVEFVLSVLVHPYKGDVLSVWIFLGTVFNHET